MSWSEVLLVIWGALIGLVLGVSFVFAFNALTCPYETFRAKWMKNSGVCFLAGIALIIVTIIYFVYK